MVKELLIAHHLVKISGKKYVKLQKKKFSFQKPKKILNSTKMWGEK